MSCVLHNIAARRVANVIRSTKLSQLLLGSIPQMPPHMWFTISSILQLINGSDVVRCAALRWQHVIFAAQRNRESRCETR